MIIVYTGKARQDLRAVYDYICFHLLSPDTAKETTNRIMKAVRALDTMPERNPLYKEEPWHSQGVRFFAVRNYLVFYIVDREADVVSVIRIMYGGRNISDQLNETAE